jgi:hypothetical protein
MSDISDHKQCLIIEFIKHFLHANTSNYDAILIYSNSMELRTTREATNYVAT